MSKKKEPVVVSNFKLKPVLFWGLAVLIIFIGIAFRFLPYNNVVTDNSIQLKGADAYFFTRQASEIKTLGYLPKVDPYLCFPAGFQYDQSAGLYPTTIALMSNFTSLEMATAISSPIFAGLFFIVILFFLKELFEDNDYAVLGGLLVASLTGIQFISRSYFGFGDRHVLETLLFTLGLFTLIKATKKDSLIWAVLSGISFALYNYAWGQSSMMILMLVVGILLVILLKDKIAKKYLWLILIIFVIQILPALIFSNFQLLGIVLAGMVAIIGAYLIRIKVTVKWKRLAVLTLLVGLLIGGIYFIFPQFYQKVYYIIDTFVNPNGSGPTVSEAVPLFTIYSQINLFDTVFFQLLFMFVGLFGLFLALKKQHFILVVCGAGLFILTLIRIRSEYYYLIFSSIGIAFVIQKYPKTFYIVAASVILFFLQYASAWSSDLQNQNSSLAFTNADYKMAAWMKDNLPKDVVSDNNQANYGIMADWPLGYLYTYVADKSMFAEPNFCNYIEPARFLMLQDLDSPYLYMKDRGLKYVLVKPVDLNKYYYFLTQLDTPKKMQAVQGTIDGEKKIFVGQNYFTTMSSRLYNFNGEAYTPTLINTITANKELNEYKTYEEAKASGAVDFFSTDLYKSPVPLEKLQHFKLIHDEQDSKGGVKLFEVVD